MSDAADLVRRMRCCAPFALIREESHGRGENVSNRFGANVDVCAANEGGLVGIIGNGPLTEAVG